MYRFETSKIQIGPSCYDINTFYQMQHALSQGDSGNCDFKRVGTRCSKNEGKVCTFEVEDQISNLGFRTRISIKQIWLCCQFSCPEPLVRTPKFPKTPKLR